MVGTKKKGGKTVPNCVPKESRVGEARNAAQQAAIAKKKKKSATEGFAQKAINSLFRGKPSGIAGKTADEVPTPPTTGDLNTSHMNKQHQDFYDKNPSFKGTDKEIVSFGDRKLATRVSPAGGVPKVEKKPIGFVPPQHGVKEGGNKYKIKSTGSDINPATKNREDYFISPSTGKKVYKKAKVGDHENPNSGEHKPKVEGQFARAIMKEFGLK
jgi:hypothetical protein